MTAAEDRLGEIEGRLSDAHEEIGKVAANVRERWRMSIPARPDYDTDLIISRALTEGEKAVAALLAVLALHRPSMILDEFDPYCIECWEAGGMDGAPSYPCPTVTAITATLAPAKVEM